jgi:gamma-glutamylcyclotransferase (GGCT)/AIG2-like uncharacterized protein YtfP
VRVNDAADAGRSTIGNGCFVFAYGTLRDAACLNELIGNVSGWRVAGEGSIQGRLYDVGEYPALVSSDDAHDRVGGILIELDDPEPALKRLDTYEGVEAGLYRRELRTVDRSGGTLVDAWVYVYQRSVQGLLRIAGWPVPFS